MHRTKCKGTSFCIKRCSFVKKRIPFKKWKFEPLTIMDTWQKNCCYTLVCKAINVGGYYVTLCTNKIVTVTRARDPSHASTCFAGARSRSPIKTVLWYVTLFLPPSCLWHSTAQQIYKNLVLRNKLCYASQAIPLLQTSCPRHSEFIVCKAIKTCTTCCFAPIKTVRRVHASTTNLLLVVPTVSKQRMVSKDNINCTGVLFCKIKFKRILF